MAGREASRYCTYAVSYIAPDTSPSSGKEYNLVPYKEVSHATSHTKLRSWHSDNLVYRPCAHWLVACRVWDMDHHAPSSPEYPRDHARDWQYRRHDAKRRSDDEGDFEKDRINNGSRWAILAAL